MQDSDKDEKLRKRIRMMTSYATLPFVLGVPPIVGWYVGSWLDHYFDIAPYGKYGFLVIGIISGIREAIRMIKLYKDEDV